MRIVKLNQEPKEFKTGPSTPYYFGDDIVFYMGPNGEFELGKYDNKVEPGEWLAFSYHATIVYVGVVKSGNFEKDGSKFFCIDKTRLKEGNGKTLQDLREELQNIGISIVTQGQKWISINIDDEDAKRILQKFVSGNDPL